jgi:TonB-dependent starch-binding outer membrane protein SusC
MGAGARCGFRRLPTLGAAMGMMAGFLLAPAPGMASGEEVAGGISPSLWADAESHASGDSGGSRAGLFATSSQTASETASQTASQTAERGTLRGQVTDRRSGRLLPGAQIQVEGTGLGTLTDGAGRYVLAGVPAGDVVLRVRYLGYGEATREVSVQAGGDQAVDFALAEAALSLDGIVVTGTAGQARQREVGNSIVQLDVSRLDEPVASVDQLLQGRAPSVTVNPGSASFGAGAAIRLRGNVSASMSNQPLIFVDGVRQSAEAYPLNASQGNFPHWGPSSTMSPLNDINPSDIERIEVVKGAAATTLYGSEASAGVIQIFTRSGTQGQAVWSLQSDHGVDWVRPFGSEERPYLGLDPWLRRAYGTRNSLSVSGGTDGVRYFVAGGLDREEGVLPNDEGDRATLRVNLDLDVRPDVALQFNTAYTRHSLSITHTGNSAMGLPLNAFRQPFNSFGSSDPEVLSQLLDAKIFQDNDRFNTGLTATWNPRAGITQRVTLGLDRIATRGTQSRPVGFALEPEGMVSDLRWESRTLTVDYTGSLRWLNAPALASTFSWGAQSITTEETTSDAYGSGLPGPGVHTVSGAAQRLVFGEELRVISAGFFLQNLFGFRDRAFLTLGARVDGNSAFGENLGLQVYPKASASWVVSEEDFWAPEWGEVKLRAAYGLAGRAPGAFDAVRTWQPNSFGGAISFVPSNVGNPDLGPEKTREIEVGVDGSWLDGRLSAEATYYDQVTRDALFNVAQIPTTGFSGGQLENVGELTNRGFELALDGTVVDGPDLSWELGLSLSTNRSQVVDVGTATAYTIQPGQPAPAVRGTWVRNADENAAPDIVLDHFFGPNQPTRIVGLRSTLHLPRGVRFTARGEYQGGHYIVDGASANMVNRGSGAPGCEAAYRVVPVDGYAGADLDGVRAIDRVRCYPQALRPGVWVYPADFFKVRELTVLAPVTAFVPGVRNATLTLSLSNAFRWTNDEFLAFDPEMVSSRQTTSSLTSGITEHAPAPARFAASLRVTF